MEFQFNNESKSNPIDVNLSLNQKEQEIEQLSVCIQIDEIKEDSIQVCKYCMDKKCQDVNKSLCMECKYRFKIHRISNSIFLSSLLITSLTSGLGFSLSSIVSITNGLCIAVILQSIFNLVIFFRN